MRVGVLLEKSLVIERPPSVGSGLGETVRGNQVSVRFSSVASIVSRTRHVPYLLFVARVLRCPRKMRIH